MNKPISRFEFNQDDYLEGTVLLKELSTGDILFENLNNHLAISGLNIWKMRTDTICFQVMKGVRVAMKS